MYDSKKIIAIIPARGGSKGIAKKNIKLLAGNPLIAYTIEAGLNSKYIDNIFVTTDDEEIADTSRKYGAELIKRPREIAKDDSPTIDVIFHVLDSLLLDKYDPSIVVLLQPTSPLRDAKDIDDAVELFVNSDCESLVSVCEVNPSPYWIFKIEDQYLRPIFEDKYLFMRRQDLPVTYVPNGALYISTPLELYKYNGFYCEKSIPYIMSVDKSIDIDNEIDLILAEKQINTIRRDS